MSEPILEVRHLVKEFPGVRALNDVTFALLPGEVHALIGENGAGKSTLLKVLSGVHPAGTYQGDILMDGKPQHFRSTRDAEAAGIRIIHQELNLIPELTVAENIFLGHEPMAAFGMDWAVMFQESRRVLEQLHEPLDPRTPVRDLGVGKQQMVEIARAIRQSARVLLLDEPTSALTEREVGVLFDTVRRLKAQGVTCVYISHKLDELFAIGDRCTVLRDGSTVGTAAISDLTEERIIGMMVGRKIDEIFPARDHVMGSAVLELRNFSVDHPLLPGEHLVHDVNLEVRAGEILGVAGLMGSGRSELLTGLFGAWPEQTHGEVIVQGQPHRFRSCLDAIHAGIGLVTEDRKLFGLVLGMSVRENTTLASLERLTVGGVLNLFEERQVAQHWSTETHLAAASPEVSVQTLSGGNQQKVVLSKWLATEPKVLLLDEPTRGVDVGARTEIYHLINGLLKKGLAILMVSSSLPEVLKMSDRVLVMREGHPAALLNTADATQELVMQYATGTAA